jgi:hypothetical protein
MLSVTFQTPLMMHFPMMAPHQACVLLVKTACYDCCYQQVNLTTDSYVMVLTGVLPSAAAFKGLPGLRVIDIRMNALRGPLPDDWSTLGGQLEVVRLSQNFLNGEGEPWCEVWCEVLRGCKLIRTAE